MPDCDGFFELNSIPFLPEYQDIAVATVLQEDFYNPQYKKELILCWFDTTYGTWNGSRFDLNNSRLIMASHLKTTPYATYEAMIEHSQEAQLPNDNRNV